MSIQCVQPLPPYASVNPPIQKTVTSDIAFSVAGAASIYGSAITLNQNLASTASGNISLYTNSLSIAASKTISSAGNLIIEPQTNGTSIGLAGGTGTLAITADYFANKFTDGFSEIRIGNSAAGTITHGASLTLNDPLQLITAGNLASMRILYWGPMISSSVEQVLYLPRASIYAVTALVN